jgi:protoporphyrinogen IX oxidase
MTYFILKALHLIFIVTWFAGLFYIVRIFIYQTESNEKPEPERSILLNAYKKNAKPLWYGITWPSMILTVIFGTALLIVRPELLKMSFMHVKLGLVILLIGYHFACHHIYNKLQSDKHDFTSMKLRLWNEVATLFLFAIIFVIVLKQYINWYYAVGGLLALAMLTYLGVIAYKKRREKK